jgi:hypothetical protein
MTEINLICRDDEGREHHFACANGFVSRVVSAIFHSDQMGCYSDARRVMDVMNADARKTAELDSVFSKLGQLRGGPTESNPNRPYCKPDQSCCDFCCGN